MRTAPHNQPIRQIDGAPLEDPARWAMTWRAYLRKHRPNSNKSPDR